MRLYVMRHGPAEDRAPSGRDYDRALTSVGRRVVERGARALHEARGGAALRVIASPFRRAHETAELLARRFGGDVELDDDLGADRDLPMALVRAVRAAGGDAILVGHQPTVEELVRALASPVGPSLSAGFRTATIVTLESSAPAQGPHPAPRPDERWHLRAVIDPHTLAD